MRESVLFTVVAVFLLAMVGGCSQGGNGGPGLTGPGLEAPGADAVVENVIIYKAFGRFGGWPANNGIWQWGDEILVGFDVVYYKEPDPDIDPTDHHFDREKPKHKALARSLDGGRTWTIEEPENFAGQGREAAASPGGINFTHPGFAMRVGGSQFFVSYDKGRNWQGPYQIEMGGGEKKLTSRTDYIVNGKDDCLLFMSARHGAVRDDRAMCARTIDGGKTFEFVSWMTKVYPPQRMRSVMPSTVLISDTGLVSALRRKLRLDDPKCELNWIDVYISEDSGENWRFLSKVADTDNDEWNGNPPSMVRLDDGRLCVTYGYRGWPWGIRAKLSDDDGKTWSDEIVLRDDGLNWDLGYTRTVQRTDGRLVTIYYYNTKENPQQHIAATIWDPGS